MINHTFTPAGIYHNTHTTWFKGEKKNQDTFFPIYGWRGWAEANTSLTNTRDTVVAGLLKHIILKKLQQELEIL